MEYSDNLETKYRDLNKGATSSNFLKDSVQKLKVDTTRPMYQNSEQKRFSSYQPPMYNNQLSAQLPQGGQTLPGSMGMGTGLAQSQMGSTPQLRSESYDPLPNQRSRNFFENKMVPPSNWFENNIGVSSEKAMFSSAASTAGLGTMYDDMSRFGDKIPFLGSFFDRTTLRNEFENFILLKLAGASSDVIRNAVVDNSRLMPFAKTNFSPNGPDKKPTIKLERKEAQISPPQISEPRAAWKKETAEKKSEKLQKKHFFDDFSDKEENKWNENDPNMPSTLNRETFGGYSSRGSSSRGRGNTTRRGSFQRFNNRGRDENETRPVGALNSRTTYRDEKQNDDSRPKRNFRRTETAYEDAENRNDAQRRRGRGHGFRRGEAGGRARGAARGRGSYRGSFGRRDNPSEEKDKKESVADENNYFASGSADSGEDSPIVEESTWGSKSKAAAEVSFGEPETQSKPKKDGKDAEVDFGEGDSGKQEHEPEVEAAFKKAESDEEDVVANKRKSEESEDNVDFGD